MNEGLQVLMVSAFWRDNEPDGISAGMRFDAPTNGVEFCTDLEKTLPLYDKLGLQHVRAELVRLAPHRHELDMRDVMHVVACIYWMQERGHIKPDEYNGALFACSHEGTLASCERNPVTIDVAAEIKGKSAVDVTDIFRASKGGPLLDRGLTAAVRAVVDHKRREGLKAD